MTRRGFTLLELIIILAVVSTLSVFSLASYSTLNKEKTLQAETEQFIETLELAKKKVTAGDKLRCATTLTDYSVTITSTTSYTLIAGCATGDVTLATYQFPTNSPLVFSDYTAAETVFTPLSSGATANCIALSDPKLNKCRQVSVSTAATIGESGTDCSCP